MKQSAFEKLSKPLIGDIIMKNPSTTISSRKNIQPDSISSQISVSNSSQNMSEKNEQNSHKSGKWTKEEDELLLNSISKHGEKNWKLISRFVPGRNPVQCLHRWSKILQPGLIKGPWTIDEDRKLLNWVKREGPNKWASCAEFIKGRSGKQCRERWHNTLNPTVKKGNWEPEEDYLIFKLYQKYGTQWSKINQHFARRTENSVKNRFYSTLRRLAAEHKRRRLFSGNMESETENKSTGDPLLNFIPEAIREKTIKLMRKYYSQNETMSNSDGISARMSENEEIEYFNSIPLSELEKKIEQFCSIEKQNEDGKANMECEGTNVNIQIIDKQINNFIDNVMDKNKETNVEKVENNRILFDDDNNMNEEICSQNHFHCLKDEYNHTLSLIDQLNDLEELLKETKKNLLEKQVSNEKKNENELS